MASSRRSRARCGAATRSSPWPSGRSPSSCAGGRARTWTRSRRAASRWREPSRRRRGRDRHRQQLGAAADRGGGTGPGARARPGARRHATRDRAPPRGPARRGCARPHARRRGRLRGARARPGRAADVGGRTTELTLGVGERVLGAASLPLGALALTEAHGADLDGAHAAVGAVLAASELPARARTVGARLAASGGTATALAALDLGLGAYVPRR